MSKMKATNGKRRCRSGSGSGEGDTDTLIACIPHQLTDTRPRLVQRHDIDRLDRPDRNQEIGANKPQQKHSNKKILSHLVQKKQR